MREVASASEMELLRVGGNSASEIERLRGRGSMCEREGSDCDQRGAIAIKGEVAQVRRNEFKHERASSSEKKRVRA